MNDSSEGDDGADQLVAWGRVIRVATRGRNSGRTQLATIGFVEEPDGSLLVAAGDPDADWALNLFETPRCQVTLAAQSFVATAEPLIEDEHNRAVRELVLRYGTPSERLGLGPSFRLRPV